MKALEINELTKIYSNGLQALKGISFDVEEGDFFALLGPNGAGKSTTIGIVTSLVNKTSGQVKVFGHDMDKELEVAKSYIGLVPQEFNFNIFETVWQIVTNQAGYYGVPRALAKLRAEKYLKKLGLWEKRNQQSRFLSGGMKRRLMIARALLHEPKLLILDEPTAGVDIEVRRSMWDFLTEINKEGITIILTTHYLEEAESMCERVAIINFGEIIVNTELKDLLKQLSVETFIIYLEQPLQAPPELEDFTCQLIDELTLSIEVSREKNLDQLFTQLRERKIQVASMRNKVNRLEELFLKLTKQPMID